MAGERYTHITQKEFDAFMATNFFECLNPDQRAQELVYLFTWNDDNYLLKVYSSIVLGMGSREVGADAIRVVLFINTPQGIRAMWRAPRVYRTENWRAHLQQRINEGMLRGREGKNYKCESCGAPMILREGKRGLFWGCSMFPISGCRYTEEFVAGDDET